jgi:hypothetical protein
MSNDDEFLLTREEHELDLARKRRAEAMLYFKAGGVVCTGAMLCGGAVGYSVGGLMTALLVVISVFGVCLIIGGLSYMIVKLQ